MNDLALNEDQLEKVNKIETELNKIESNLSNVELAINIVYEECAEFMLQIQLYTEETIARIKVENNIGVNVDESELSESLQFQINELQLKSESLIEQIEKHLKNYISSSNMVEAKKFIQKRFEPLKHRIKELRQGKHVCDDNSINFLQDVINKKEWKHFLFENNLIELNRRETQNPNEFPFFISFNQVLSLGKSRHHTLNFSEVSYCIAVI
jgi:hypothetical protein